MSGQYRILVIERDAGEALPLRQLLCACAVGDAGVEVLIEGDTASALDNFSASCPDLVVYGPVASKGVVADNLKQLRARAGSRPLPILLVKLAEEALSSDCLDIGCTDILSKPYELPLVQLKIDALRRFSGFSRSLVAQRDRMRRHHADLLQEQASVRQIFDNMGRESCLDQTAAIRYHLSPRAVLNGDVLAAAYGPGGKLLLLLGDFTGHGLAAAVGAVPLTSIFYSMVPKGFSLCHIVREINAKLHRVLPGNMFCCAIIFELDPHKKQIRVFNGGMPAACLRRGNGDLRMLESRHLPLGVTPEAATEESVVHVPVGKGDRLYLWSDGVHETRNRAGELFGEQRLLEAVSAPLPDAQRFEHILAVVNTHCADQQDDLSLVEVKLDEVASGPITSDMLPARCGCEEVRIGDWSINFTLGSAELRDTDPLPLIHSLLAQVPGTGKFRDDLSIVLSELFRNALEHGLLNLDSDLKKDSEGFAEYYRQLMNGRRQLNEGWIRIELDCRDRGCGGELEVVVEDSGAGLPESTDTASVYAGRGLMLLRAFCTELELEPGSSRVRALLTWGEPACEEDAVEDSVQQGS